MKPKDKTNGELIDALPKKGEPTEKYSCGCPLVTQVEVDAGAEPPLWMMSFTLPGGSRMTLTQCTVCKKILGGSVAQPEIARPQEPSIILGH
jgi:hypothetical protein